MNTVTANNSVENNGKNSRLNAAVILSWLFVFGGIFGFIYEELFYRIDLGYFVKRGSTYGPWVPIYGFGAMLIFVFTKKLRNRPFLVFALSAGISALLELATGYVLFHVFATRLWDYNIEIWNWLNIGGYICLRSVLFFGASGLLLQYFVYPLLSKMQNLMDGKRTLVMLTLLPSVAFALDIAIYNIMKLF